MEEYAYLYDLPREDFCGRGLHYIPRLQYGREHPRQYMECIYRDSAAEGAVRPVVVWVHGGGWQDDNLMPDYRPEKVLAEMAEAGYFIACIEYRLGQHAKFPACVEDCQAAVQYIRTHAGELGIDPERIALWGESAGAHIASMTGLNFNRAKGAEVQAVVAWYCPSDLAAQKEGTGEEEIDIVSCLIGCDARTNPDRVRAASPVTYAGAAAGWEGRNIPPFLLMHGNEDELVDCAQSVKFHKLLGEAGCDAELVTIPGQGHGFFRGDGYYQIVKDFIADRLMKAHSL